MSSQAQAAQTNEPLDGPTTFTGKIGIVLTFTRSTVATIKGYLETQLVGRRDVDRMDIWTTPYLPLYVASFICVPKKEVEMHLRAIGAAMHTVHPWVATGVIIQDGVVRLSLKDSALIRLLHFSCLPLASYRNRGGIEEIVAKASAKRRLVNIAAAMEYGTVHAKSNFSAAIVCGTHSDHDAHQHRLEPNGQPLDAHLEGVHLAAFNTDSSIAQICV